MHDRQGHPAPGKFL